MNTHTKTVAGDAKSMARTALEMLNVNEGCKVALLLGYSSELSNQAATCRWFSDFMSKHPEKCDFKNDLMPALVKTLEEYRNSIW